MLVRYLVLCVFVSLASVLAANAQPRAEAPIKAIGAFSNVKFSGEHAAGYSIKMWKQGNKVIGLISSHQGLIGDPPTGTLKNVRYDARSQKLSFTAKISLGSVFLDAYHDEVPSQDVLNFSGYLSKTKLTGTLVKTNKLCRDKCRTKEQISLVRRKGDSEELDDYKSRSEWTLYAKEILDRLGPQW